MAEPAYRTSSYLLKDAGLVARYVSDRAPDATFSNLKNLEARQENGMSSRFGRQILTTNGTNNSPLGSPSPVHTLSRLKGISQVYRYGAASTGLWRATGNGQQTWTQINNTHPFSGNRFSTTIYRPNFSSVPYIFFADSAQMMKDNGSFADGTANPLEQWGINPPTIPPELTLEPGLSTTIDNFLQDFGYNYVNVTPYVSAAISTISRNVGIVTVNTAAPVNPFVGQFFIIAGVTNVTFDGNFAVTTTGGTSNFEYRQPLFGPASSSGGTASSHTNRLVQTTIAAAIVGPAQVTVTPASMTNISVGMMLQINAGQADVEVVTVSAVGGSTFTAVFGLNHAPGATVTNYALSGSIAASTTATITKLGPLNLSLVGGSPSMGSDLLSFFVEFNTPGNVTSVTILFDVGDGSFSTDYYSAPLTPTGTLSLLTVMMSAFAANGSAGTPGHSWGDVTGYQIQIVTNGSGGVTFNLANFYLSGTGGPDSSSGGTSPYDYRYTYFNINTGDESNPSVPLTENNYISPTNQPILVTWTASPDPQVTHVNIYRRGGTLTDGWIMVAQVPIGTTEYIDGFTDAQIADGAVLEIDNDVPVTSTLQVPLNATLSSPAAENELQTVDINFGTGFDQVYPNQILTVGIGDRQETVTVISVGGGTFTAFFQFEHPIGDPVTASTRQATPINLAAIAYQMAWLAGDPNNPHILYYSKPENPEAFPPENTLEIGTPDQPIMALVYFAGQLFVFTTATVWLIFAPGSNIPTPIPTGVTHGLVSNFGWTIVEGGQIWYQSYDGTYACTGFGSTYVSKPVEWLPRGQNLGPVLAYDTTQLSSVLMAYRQNEVFTSYQQTDGNRGRIIYDTTYQRWRNDDVGATAMFHELDTDELIIGLSDGNVYIDRVGDYDDGGYIGGTPVRNPINFSLQTPELDQGLPKNEKVYQELTIDINTNGQDVSATLLFDYGQTVVPISATINTTERAQVCLNVNAGVGQRSLNCALLLTGAATEVVTLFEWHIRAEVDAERRQSFDTYWQKYGTDEWKFVKQGWFEYETPGGQAITMNVYLDGSANVSFSFVLPAVTSRATNRIRFPAKKFSTIRFIGTSSADFKIYTESKIEMKTVCHDKGYYRSPLEVAPPQEQ